MSRQIRAFSLADLPQMMEIWNEVVRDGVAFPQTEPLASREEASRFFSEQSFTGVAETDGAVRGLYILHPNNIGRCGHIANASYAVSSAFRGQKDGEALVRHSLQKAGELGFRIMQFNAVVSSNAPALHLYEKIGFQRLGVVPGGFRMKDGSYSDIVLFYYLIQPEE